MWERACSRKRWVSRGVNDCPTRSLSHHASTPNHTPRNCSPARCPQNSSWRPCWGYGPQMPGIPLKNTGRYSRPTNPSNKRPAATCQRSSRLLSGSRSLFRFPVCWRRGSHRFTVIVDLKGAGNYETLPNDWMGSGCGFGISGVQSSIAVYFTHEVVQRAEHAAPTPEIHP